MKIAVNKNERSELLAAKERLLNRNKARDENITQAGKHESDARKLIAEADQFDRTGDIHDTAEVAKADTKRRQAEMFNRRAQAFRAQAKDEDAKVWGIIDDAGGIVKRIGARILDEWQTELMRGLLPLYWEEGRALNIFRASDFFNGFHNWTERSHNGIVNVETRAVTVIDEIDHLLAHGIPERFNCPFLDLSQPAAQIAEEAAQPVSA